MKNQQVLKENRNDKVTKNNHKITVEIFETHGQMKSLKNSLLTGCIKGKRSSGKQQVTCLTNLCKYIEEQMPRK